MGKQSNRKTTVIAVVAAVSLLIVGVVFDMMADGSQWLGTYIASLVITAGTWVGIHLNRVARSVQDVRRIAVATAGALVKTDERVVKGLGAMREHIDTAEGKTRTELTEQIITTSERAAVERAIAGSKQRQADFDDQQTGRIVDVQQTLAAMSVRLLTMSNKQEAVFATLRSLPGAQAEETTLPSPDSEASSSDDPPSGVHSNYGRAMLRTLDGPRSWTLDNPPQLRSSRPKPEQQPEPADDDDATALFDRAQLTLSSPSPAERPIDDMVADERQSTARRLKDRALARLAKARAERGETEPPSSGE